jgi:hypothetical protein
MRVALLFLALAIFFGCSSVATAPYKSIVYVQKSATEVELAIMRGAADCNWSVQKVGANTLQVKRANGKKQVIADITFSAQEYTIHHNSSTNMKHNPADNTISGDYTDWLNDLDLAIQKELVK